MKTRIVEIRVEACWENETRVILTKQFSGRTIIEASQAAWAYREASFKAEMIEALRSQGLPTEMSEWRNPTGAYLNVYQILIK